MQTLSKTWFISDLHLDPSHQENINQFMKLMDNCDQSVDDIYILGDLFEVWIGDDERSKLHDEIALQLKKTGYHGTKTHFMHGNRDFLLGSRFLSAAGCELLQVETKISLYGKPVLLMHGDTLCTQDTAYLRARKFAHNKIIQQIFLWLPITIRQKIAASARNASTKHTSSTDAAIMDVTQSEVENMMQKHHVSHLIHGHTHRPDTHTFQIDGIEKTRIVLPAWHGDVSVFEWRSDGTSGFVKI